MDYLTRHLELLCKKSVIPIQGAVMTAAILCFFLPIQGIGSDVSDDCRRARDLYARGVAQIDLSERKQVFQKAVKLCPSYAEAHVNLADAYEHLKDLASAEQHYKKAIDLGLDSPVPFIGLGEVYLKNARYELAAESFRKGVEVAGDNQRLQEGLRATMQRIGREQAILTAEAIRACLTDSEAFDLMCMCPSGQYLFLKKWICLPVLFFRSGYATLSRETEKQVVELATALNSSEASSLTFTLVGHTDARGTDSRNRDLARRRTQEVKRFLVSKHRVDPSRLRVKILGSAQPRADNGTAAGRGKNRRVEIVVDEE